MTPQQIKEAVARGEDLAHRRAYESALHTSGRTDLPAWDDLPEEKKAAVRVINQEHWQEMADLGRSIFESAQKGNTLSE